MSSPHMVGGVLEGTPQEVSRDLLHRTAQTGSTLRLALLLFGGLFILGIIGFVILVAGGTSDHTRWGYYAAVVAYLLTTAQAAPLVAIALRAVKSHWRRPMVRAAQLFAVVGVLNLLMYIPLIWVLPVTDGRRTIWLQWHGHAPHIYDSIAMGTLAFLGIALLYVSALPDIASGGQHLEGRRGAFLRRISLHWRGTQLQWRVQKTTLGVMGGMYFMFLIYMHFLFASDFAMSLVPGWRDSIFPAWHALSAIQSGIATVMVTMFVMRTFGGYREYLGLNQFWSLSKLLLAFSLLWMYFWFSGFITFWYGRTSQEQDVLRLLFFEQYRVPFLLAFILNFVTPLLLLMWNGVRRSILGPTLAAFAILVGTFFDRIRIYVGSFSVEKVTGDSLEVIPGTVTPGVADVLVLVGGIGGAIFFFLLATRLISLVSIWESAEGLMYVLVRPLLRGKYVLMGKPD